MINRVIRQNKSLDSYFALQFDGNDQYALPPLTDTDWLIEFSFLFTSVGDYNYIIKIEDSLSVISGNSVLALIDSSRRFTMAVIDTDAIDAISWTSNALSFGTYYTARMIKTQNNYKFYFGSNLVLNQTMTAPINFAAMDIRELGTLLTGTIKNVKGFYQWPVSGGPFYAWKDSGKTIPASNGNPVAVVETAVGDITQTVLANQAIAII